MRNKSEHLYAILGIIILIGVWLLIPDAEGKIIPSLIKVLACGKIMLTSGTLTQDIWISLYHVTIGITIGTLSAIVVGLFSAFPVFRYIMLGPLELARPIPPIAWIPLMLLVFGVGDKSAIALVSLATFFPVATSIILALESIDKDLVLAAKSLGASEKKLITKVYFPSMAPIVFSGIRTGIGIAWFSVVAAEMLGSYGGLGYGIQITSLNLEMERFFVYLITIGFCGYCMNSFLVFLNHKINSWHLEITDVL